VTPLPGAFRAKLNNLPAQPSRRSISRFGVGRTRSSGRLRLANWPRSEPVVSERPEMARTFAWRLLDRTGSAGGQGNA